MITIHQAQFWIEEQRRRIGMPPITDVEAGLCEDFKFVMVYVETAAGGTPLTATYELPTKITQQRFDEVRSEIEEQFAQLNTMSRH